MVVLFSFAVISVSAEKPDRPTNLTTDDISPTSIQLYWEAPDDDGDKPITGYKIETKSPPGNYYVLIYNTGSNSTTYTHQGVVTDKTYIYRIYAINDDGESNSSVEVLGKSTASSIPLEQIVPNAPTRLTAKDVSPTQIDLKWKKPVDNDSPPIIGYKIEHKVNNGPYEILVNNTADTATSYSATELATNSDYIFRVYALNSIGFSSESNEDMATPTSASEPEEELIVPNPPTGVTATALSPTEIRITWNAPESNNSPPVTSYQIEVKIGDSGYRVLADDNGSATSFNHEDLSSEVVYTYRISARNSVGLSNTSGTDSTKPEHTVTPTQVTIIGLSPTQAKLSWSPPSQTYGQSITGYEIQEKIAVGIYETVATTGGTINSHTISGLETNEAYTYVIFANFQLGSTDISEEITITLTEDSGADERTVPSKPINLQATAASPIQIDLSWDAPANAGGSPVIGYRIDFKVDSGEYITLVEDTQSIGRTYTHQGRTPDTEYSYRVYAINDVGLSRASNVASETPTASSTPPSSGTVSSSPQNMLADLVSADQANLSWYPPALDGGSSIRGYKIEVKKDTGAFVVLSPNIGTRTTYSHGGLDPDTTYTYRVYAINSIGDSNPSNLATITTVPEKIEPVDPLLRIPGFPDPEVDPQYYIDRYNNEKEYKEWFDMVFPEYTITDIVGTPEPKKDPRTEREITMEYYLDRYDSELEYKRWFDSYFAGKSLQDVIPQKASFGICGEGTKLKDGICQIIIE